MKFINRSQELAFLQRKYISDKAEFIIIYGRRRIGKTELINKFSEHRPTLYFLGRTESKTDTIRRFNLMLTEYFEDISLVRSPLSNWDDCFEYLAKRADEKLLLVIDEFPLIAVKFPEILSILQDKWDNLFNDTKLMLILCGSSVSMMEKYTLDYNSPLYGRRTGQWMVDRLDIIHLKEFFPSYSFEDILTLYSVIDTIPGYLMQFDSNIPVWDNIESKILSKGEFLYEEVEILLREELRDPSNYMSILSSIAGGLTTFSEISHKTLLDKSLLSKYLYILTRLGIVERNLPVTEGFKRKLKAYGARYCIKDNFFDFWFRFVYTNLSELERSNLTAVSGRIHKEFPAYLGTKFERMMIDIFPHLDIFSHGEFFTSIGRWWYKDKEIDIVVLNENTDEIIFCECKWQNRATGVGILKELLDKSSFVNWNNDTRVEKFIVVSRSGFTQKALDYAKDHNIILFTPKEICKIFEDSR